VLSQTLVKLVTPAFLDRVRVTVSAFDFNTTAANVRNFSRVFGDPGIFTSDNSGSWIRQWVRNYFC
jgi:hypothetical protein